MLTKKQILDELRINKEQLEQLYSVKTKVYDDIIRLNRQRRHLLETLCDYEAKVNKTEGK